MRIHLGYSYRLFPVQDDVWGARGEALVFPVPGLGQYCNGDARSRNKRACKNALRHAHEPHLTSPPAPAFPAINISKHLPEHENTLLSGKNLNAKPHTLAFSLILLHNPPWSTSGCWCRLIIGVLMSSWHSTVLIWRFSCSVIFWFQILLKQHMTLTFFFKEQHCVQYC